MYVAMAVYVLIAAQLDGNIKFKIKIYPSTSDIVFLCSAALRL
jgi:hypothetical protein